jgi:hypothetical protein
MVLTMACSDRQSTVFSRRILDSHVELMCRQGLGMRATCNARAIMRRARRYNGYLVPSLTGDSTRGAGEKIYVGARAMRSALRAWLNVIGDSLGPPRSLELLFVCQNDCRSVIVDGTATGTLLTIPTFDQNVFPIRTMNALAGSMRFILRKGEGGEAVHEALRYMLREANRDPEADIFTFRIAKASAKSATTRIRRLALSSLLAEVTASDDCSSKRKATARDYVVNIADVTRHITEAEVDLVASDYHLKLVDQEYEDDNDTSDANGPRTPEQLADVERDVDDFSGHRLHGGRLRSAACAVGVACLCDSPISMLRNASQWESCNDLALALAEVARSADAATGTSSTVSTEPSHFTSQTEKLITISEKDGVPAVFRAISTQLVIQITANKVESGEYIAETNQMYKLSALLDFANATSKLIIPAVSTAQHFFEHVAASELHDSACEYAEKYSTIFRSDSSTVCGPVTRRETGSVDTSTVAHKYTMDEVLATGHAFHGRPARRAEVSFLSSTGRTVADVQTCTKGYVSSNNVSPGIMVVGCGCGSGTLHGVSLMLTTESLQMYVSILQSR